MGTVWVFQHLEEESPDLIGRVLEEEGHQLRMFRSYRQELPPAIAPGCEGLVVMGGPMGVYEADRYAWITPEIELIRGALDRRLPLMAVCVGSQLLAAAAGARVYPGERAKEIGWHTVRLTPAGAADALCAALAEPPGAVDAANAALAEPLGAADAANAALAEPPGAADAANAALAEATVFQWHGDTFDLPPGAELLASSNLYPHQAFRLGRCAYGFQFHFEVGAESISQWLELWPEELRAEGVDVEAVKAQTAGHMEAFTRRGRALISGFSAMVRATEAIPA